MEDRCVCPFCGGDNNCGTCVGDSSCWCTLVVVSVGLIQLLPENQRGRNCICRSCISMYEKSPETFARSLRE